MIFFRRLFFFILFTLLLLIAALFFIGSEPGTKLIWNFISDKYSDQVSAKKMSGGIADQLHFEGLEVHLPDLDLRIEKLDFSWQLTDLLQRRLIIDYLKISNVIIDDRREKIEEESQPVVLQDIELPISISLNDFLLSNAEYHTATAEKPLILELLSFALLVDKEAIKLQRAKAKIPEAELNLSGQLQPRKNYPLDFQLDWSATIPEQPIAKGAGTISGDLEKLFITQQLTAPAEADIKLQVNQALAELDWLADIKLSPLQLQQIKSDLPAITVATQLHAEGDLKDIQLSGNYELNSQEFGDWTGALDIAQSLPTDLNIKQFEINSKNTPAEIKLSGNINLENNPDIDLHGHWQQLQWPITGESFASSKRGDLSITGQPENFQLLFTSELYKQQIGDVTLSLEGNGSHKEGSSHFNIKSLDSQLLEGSVALTGQVSMSDELRWDIKLKSSDINPERLQKDWPGKLNLSGNITGSQSAEKLAITINDTEVNGQLRTYPFKVKTDLTLLNDLLDIKQLTVTSGKSKLQATGKAGQNLDLAWDLNSQNLAELYPDASGQLIANGKLTGLQKKPVVHADIKANNLAIPGAKIGKLSSLVNIDLAQLEAKQSTKGFEIILDSSALEFGENIIDSLKLNGKGSMSAHSIKADVDAEKGKLHLVTKGGLKQEKWQGMLQELTLEEKQLGRWQLAKPNALSISKKQANVDKLCLQQKQAQLCLAATWQESGAWQASSDLIDLPLSILQPFLPEDFTLNSSVGYQLVASGKNDKNIQAKLNLKAPAGSIKLKDAGELGDFKYDSVKLDFALNQQGANAELLFDLRHPTASPIKATLKTQSFDPATVDFNTLPIQGSLISKVDDLAFIQSLTHELEQLKGNLDIDLKLTGSMSQPKVEGHTDLAAEFYLPSAGIHLKEIKLNAISQANQTFAFKGQANSGEGTLNLSGTVGLAKDGFPVSAEIKGDRFEIVNMPEAWAVASPNIKIKQQKDTLNIEGELTIPEAKLEPVGMESTVPVSNDVVIISDKKNTEPEKTSALKVTSKVKVILGEKVSLAASGFTGSLKGSLLAESSPNKPTKGTGKVTVYDGKYSAYGQKLTIDKGHIVFAGGPIDSPTLDLKVTRDIEDIVAGIYVTGPATEPELELFSTPTMNQDNILSYIMLGKPLSEATSGDGDVLVGAASSLGFKGGAMLTQKIGQGLGLDEFALSGDSKEDAALQIGKYLTPKLYISYGVGIFEAATQLKLRYDFSKRWSMEAESGTNSGMDFLYKIEK